MDNIVGFVIISIILGMCMFGLDILDKTVTVGEFDAGYHIVKSLTGGN